MLNTFENAEVQHFRRKERERHMQAIEKIGGSSLYGGNYPSFCDLDDLDDAFTPAAGADALMGTSLAKQQYPPPEAVFAFPETRRKRKGRFAVLAGMFVVVILIVSLVTVKLRGRIVGSPTLAVSTDPQRYQYLYSLILDWKITQQSELENAQTAAAKALDWLAYRDIQTTNPETLQVRYVLATFYFSTQPTDPMQSWNDDSHWLSSLSVCQWFGIICINPADSISRVQSINLTSNGLVGHLPPELALLQLDIKSLDVSSNSISGKIPNLSSLKNLQYLYLGPNNFGGNLDASGIFELSHLTNLYINDCMLVR